jgi:hypothetical protein
MVRAETCYTDVRRGIFIPFSILLNRQETSRLLLPVLLAHYLLSKRPSSSQGSFFMQMKPDQPYFIISILWVRFMSRVRFASLPWPHDFGQGKPPLTFPSPSDPAQPRGDATSVDVSPSPFINHPLKTLEKYKGPLGGSSQVNPIIREWLAFGCPS